MFSYRTLAFSFSVLLLAGALCWRLTSTSRADGETAPVAEKQPDINQLLDAVPLAELEGDTLMQADDFKISMSKVELAEKSVIEAKTKENPKFVAEPDFKVYMHKQFAIKYYVNQLVEKLVKQNKADMAQDKLDAEFNKFKAEVASQSSTPEQYLSSPGMSDEEFRKDWGLKWALHEYMLTEVKESEVEKQFAEFKDHMAEIPLRRASHILFMYKESQGASEAKITRTKEEAKAAAEDVLKQLKAGGDFAALAKGKSDCPSKEKGGDLNFFPATGERAMEETFSKATYGLEKVGDITAVVETPFGFHIIKLTELRNSDDLKKLVRGKLAQDLLSQKLEKAIVAGLSKAKFNAKYFPATPKPDAKPEPAPKAEPLTIKPSNTPEPTAPAPKDDSKETTKEQPVKKAE